MIPMDGSYLLRNGMLFLHLRGEPIGSLITIKCVAGPLNRQGAVKSLF